MLTDEKAPAGDRRAPMSPALRRDLMSGVRRQFLTTSSFEHLSMQFDRMLELLDPSIGGLDELSPDEKGGDIAAGCVGPLAADIDVQPVDDIDDDALMPEGRILVLTGETGAGKSRALKRLFRKRHNELGGRLLSITAPSPCTLMQLGRTLLPELGYPIQLDRKEHLIWEEVRRRLKTEDKRVLHIDEMQHVTQTANVDQQERILNTIKSLVQRRRDPMILILSGTCDLANFLRTDGQVMRRCRFVEFGRLTLPSAADPIAETIENLVSFTPLTIEPEVADDLAGRLVHAANFALGVAIELICEAIEEALRFGDTRLLPDHFATVFWLRTGCPNTMNPFRVQNWSDTDPMQVLDRPRTDVDPQKPAPIPRKAPKPRKAATPKRGRGGRKAGDSK
ncbi:ATP-binding protein [Methylobacterium isbiliense]|jgi:hypothetical protein|uniref:ORC1/DEAH AAA+ ATPase domain-containing protein n=1 Tax=Methylobacterium isbiliense TaxID=315478 RepID=A0ABQ4SKX7_9HYPH|nr:ATP-binding protein [Methylobacterium isbiliense]MDN3626020.1 ATP-binding protein [Methylobacterium isbiliense]GJE02331.1 hypothetical protein GMJLKIPL_4278 [Methylobacterium isbiliense]